MRKGILNAWPLVCFSPEGKWVSRVTLESTALPDGIHVEKIQKDNLWVYRITLDGMELIMADDDITVADGLIKLVSIHSTGPFRVTVDICLEQLPDKTFGEGNDDTNKGLPVHKPEMSISQASGLPCFMEFSFSRKPLQNLFGGIKIGIDPGHGGSDRGYQGPVDLTEKHVTLELAKELSALLELSQGLPILTRKDDSHLTDEGRHRLLVANSPTLGVQIHVSGVKNPLIQKYRVAANNNCMESYLLGSETSAALFERMGMRVETIDPLTGEFGWPFPVIRVEPLCLTHFADEANFRAPLFRKRIAQSIYNGIARYLAKQNRLNRECHKKLCHAVTPREILRSEEGVTPVE